MEFLIYTVLTLLAAYGGFLILNAALTYDRTSTGGKQIKQISKWYRVKAEFWDSNLFQQANKALTKIVFLDNTTRTTLARQLQRAGMELTPEQFTARKYVVYAGAAIGLLVCVLLQFWFGVILCALLAIYGTMRQRETLSSRIKSRDDAIAAEMPRFVRTICRILHHNRDIHAAITSYRKVAGAVLGNELDILLLELRTGNTTSALQQFQQRIGTDSAFRLCATLQEIDRGIDQATTLDYLADDMARQAKLNIQKTLSTRPSKMRATYLPAVAVCVVMIIYVLIVFVGDQLNTLY